MFKSLMVWYCIIFVVVFLGGVQAGPRLPAVLYLHPPPVLDGVLISFYFDGVLWFWRSRFIAGGQSGRRVKYLTFAVG